MKTALANEFDFIVIGTHPGALWGALVLLEKGYSVLIIPMGESMVTHSLPRKVAGQLSIPAEDVILRDQDPLQIITPERRIRLFSDEQKFQDEYFYSYGKDFSQEFEQDPGLLRGVGYFLRGSETGPVLPQDLKEMLVQLRELEFFQTESAAFAGLFYQQIRKLGGKVAAPNSLQRIFVERKAFLGVQLDGSSTMIRASHVFIGVNYEVLKPYFEESAKAWVGAVNSSPVGWSFDMRVKVTREGVPAGITSQMLFVQPNAPILEINRKSPNEFHLKTTLPYRTESLDKREQRKIAQRMFRVLSVLIPDLEYNLKKITPDIRDPERAETVDLPSAYPFLELPQIHSHLLKYAIPGLGHSSPIQHMSFAYGESFPKWGEWGACQAIDLSLKDWAKRNKKLDLSIPSVFDAPL